MESNGMRIVPKVWGYEQWIANEHGYCGKKLYLRRGFRCSLHYHKIKDETFYVASGLVKFELDTELFTLTQNDKIRVKHHQLHRFSGFEDSIIFEFSTHHEDSDSYRVEDSGAFTCTFPAVRDFVEVERLDRVNRPEGTSSNPRISQAPSP